MPKVFTREVVRDLIARVDEGANAAVLRVPFFVPKHHPCSRVEGLRMVERALKAEVVGAKRWVLLKIIAAFGRCRYLGSIDAMAMDAYSDVFANQIEEFREDTERIVSIAIVEFLRELGTTKWWSRLPHDRTLEAVQRTTQLYVTRPELACVEPSFASALKMLTRMKVALAPLGRTLNGALEAKNGQSYHVLSRAALVYK